MENLKGTLCEVETGITAEVSTEAEADAVAYDWAAESFNNYEVRIDRPSFKGGDVYLDKTDAVLYAYFCRERSLAGNNSDAITRAIQQGNTTLYELTDADGDVVKAYTETGMIEAVYADEIKAFGGFEAYFDHLRAEYDIDEDDI